MKIDHLPASLRVMRCSDNNITKIDHLPSKLQELYYGNNLITEIDYLPVSLQRIGHDYNKITIKLSRENLYLKRSRYLRFLLNLSYRRKTFLYMILREKQKESTLLADCLPNEIIKHIVSFV